MHRGDAAGQVADLHIGEPCPLDHLRELRLGRETADAFGEVAIGLRVVGDELAEARRVLKPGGRFLCLEFSRVQVPGLDAVYDAYSMNVLPRLGQMAAGDADSYRYLAESIRRFPPQGTFARMIEKAGLARVKVRNLTGGIAAMHSAWKI